MDPIKQFAYRRWRKSLLKKGVAETAILGTRAFFPAGYGGSLAVIEEDQDHQILLERFAMVDIEKSRNDKETLRLLAELKKSSKTQVFRQDKVQEIKNRIQQQQYHVSGMEVVDKWFPKTQGEAFR